MCDEAVDDEILFSNEDFNKVIFSGNQRHILAVSLPKINFDADDNFDKDNPDTIIHIRLLVWLSEFKKRKALKKR